MIFLGSVTLVRFYAWKSEGDSSCCGASGIVRFSSLFSIFTDRLVNQVSIFNPNRSLSLLKVNFVRTKIDFLSILSGSIIGVFFIAIIRVKL